MQTQLSQRSATITLPSLFLFWVPLAVMWLLMAVEQPSLNAAMARLPRAALHLAAFEVAFGLTLVIESPILQMLSAGTALVTGRRSYRSLLRFMHSLAVILTAAQFVLSRPVVFSWIAGGLLGVPAETVEPARQVYAILVPFSALVGYRRLWQGALIRAGETGLVARTMVLRLVATVGFLVVGGVMNLRGGAGVPAGHVVAATALLIGVFTGAVSSWWYFRRRVLPRLTDNPEEEVKGLGQLLAFYVPLSLTSVMALVSRPVLAFGISRSVAPFLSLAAWPVVQSLLFMFTSIGLSYQEAVVAKMGTHGENEGVLRRFGLIFSGILTALFIVLAYTGGSALWFDHIAGLEPELIALARPAMMVLVLMPLLITGRSYFSGVLVSRDSTSFLGYSVVANTLVLVSLVVALPRFTALPGATVAAIAFTGANLAQVLFLWWGDARSRRAIRLSQNTAVNARGA